VWVAMASPTVFASLMRFGFAVKSVLPDPAYARSWAGMARKIPSDGIEALSAEPSPKTPGCAPDFALSLPYSANQGVGLSQTLGPDRTVGGVSRTHAIHRFPVLSPSNLLDEVITGPMDAIHFGASPSAKRLFLAVGRGFLAAGLKR
jgi:hypothetical protein